MIEARGVAGIRVLQGFLTLARQIPTPVLERACQTAAKHQVWRLRQLRRLCQQHRQQPELALLSEHPLIRPLDAYDAIAQFPGVSFRPPAPAPEIPYP
ncbi:MAG TPA: hypothetical protein VM221_12030 [Armatimonadota bacterium]|nr:hypothetical protein [Armatimonadota bacterium]